ncbi:MAG: hypothetical protein GYA60_05605 [Candidatus Methanofastidiosa archaeon]|nr:hypothetical protein [Candidatus Methanofastidiosa archaeon]
MVKIDFENYLILVFTALIFIIVGLIVNVITELFKNYNSWGILIILVASLLFILMTIRNQVIGKKERLLLAEINEKLKYEYLFEFKERLSKYYDPSFVYEGLFGYILLLLPFLYFALLAIILYIVNLFIREIFIHYFPNEYYSIFFRIIVIFAVILPLIISIKNVSKIYNYMFSKLNKYMDIKKRCQLISGGLFDDKSLDLIMVYDKIIDNQLRGNMYLEYRGYTKDEIEVIKKQIIEIIGINNIDFYTYFVSVL